MRCDAGDSGGLRVRFDELPNDLLAQALAPRAIGSIHGPEYAPIRDSGGGGPRVDCHLDPGGRRSGSDTAVLAYEIDDAPATVALLEMYECERGGF
jgi:hypothetical protein